MLVRISCFAALGGFLFGYDLGLISGALMFIHDEFQTSEEEEEMIVGAAKFGAIFGTFFGGFTMHSYGRRKSIAVSGIFFIVGPLLMAVATSIFGLIIGRLIIGLGVGSSAVVVPAYLGEMAPANKRGTIVALYELLLCGGLLASCIVDYALSGTKNNWRWMVGMPAFPASFMALALCVLPESPRWLVMQGKIDEALVNIAALRKCSLPEGRQLDTFSQRDQQQTSGGTSSSNTSPGRTYRSNSSGVESSGQSSGQVQMMEQELIELWSTLEKDKAALGSAMQRMSTEQREQRAGQGKRRKYSRSARSHSPGSGGVEGRMSEGCEQGGGLGEAPEVQEGVWQRLMLTLRWLLRGEERRATVLVLWLAIFNQASASTAIINYAPKLIEDMHAAEQRRQREQHGGEYIAVVVDEELHASAILATAAIGLAKLVGVTIGMCMLDSPAGGRRPLLIYGSAVMSVCMLGLAVGVSRGSVSIVVVCMLGFILAFSASWAGGFWVIVSEVFSMTAKPMVSAYTVLANLAHGECIYSAC
jgi:MFS family permease